MEPHPLEYMFYPPQCTPQAKRKKPNPFRVRLLLFCFYHYISVPPSAQCRCSLAPPQNCWPSCAFFRTLFAAGRYFMLSPWPFSRTGNLLLFCFKPAAALTGLWSFLIQPFLFSGVFAVLPYARFCNRAKTPDFPLENPAYCIPKNHSLVEWYKRGYFR